MFPKADFWNTFTMIIYIVTLYDRTKEKYHFTYLFDRDSLLFFELFIVLAFLEIL